jgi:DNA-directed RNA polymerase subunit beta'
MEVGYVNALLTKKIFGRSSVILSKLLTFQKQLSSLMISSNLVSVQPSKGGLSFNINDLIIPSIKEEVLDNAKGEVDEYGITITWV